MDRNFDSKNFNGSGYNYDKTPNRGSQPPQMYLEPEISFEQRYGDLMKKRRKRLTIAAVVIAVLVVLICLFTTVMSPIIIVGDSMLPTLEDSDLIFINRFDTTPKFQDIVVFWRNGSNDAKKRVIKRCVGLPGDTIEIKDGVLWRNGVMVEEGYLGKNFGESEYDTIILEPECYFVLGDNRDISMDSRMYGFISKNDIIGVRIA